MRHSCIPWLLGLAILTTTTCAGLAGAPNELTESEKAAGWHLLFDGKTTAGWHSFKRQSFPTRGWSVVGEWLYCAGKGGGDIVSEGLYDQFELSWDWRITKGGNSGLKYFVTDSRPSALGHEYQMYDAPGSENQNRAPGIHDTASFYDVLKPTVRPPVRPVGEVNESRVVVKGNHVEHWLNGVKVLEYDCDSDQVKAAVAASKFKTTPGFGSCLHGHILLQDHGSEVWFRNIKLRVLAAGQGS